MVFCLTNLYCLGRTTFHCTQGGEGSPTEEKREGAEDVISVIAMLYKPEMPWWLQCCYLVKPTCTFSRKEICGT